MIDEIARELGDVDPAVVYALLAFAVVSIVLQVAALLDLARREKVLWDRKWVWVLMILLINNGLGAILWFALGRRVPQPADELVSDAVQDRVAAQRAVEVLYGAPDGSSDERHEGADS